MYQVKVLDLGEWSTIGFFGTMDDALAYALDTLTAQPNLSLDIVVVL